MAEAYLPRPRIELPPFPPELALSLVFLGCGIAGQLLSRKKGFEGMAKFLSETSTLWGAFSLLLALTAKEGG